MSLKCDRCGRFASRLHDVPTNPPEGGIDHEECDTCHAREVPDAEGH